MTHPSDNDDGGRLASMEAELLALRKENVRLRGLLGLDDRAARERTTAWTPTLFARDESPTPVAVKVDRSSPTEDKIALFAALFSGRDDVYALRWENERTGKTGWGPAVRGGWTNARNPNREYLPLTDEVIGKHLAGGIHAGLYPLLRGDACRLLVCDFDGAASTLDALAYLDAAHAADIPASLERSRSSDGAHVWVFFAGKVPAASARRIGVHLLREAMTVRAELDLVSYDRLFPAQDFMPKGGSFGNLIALPLQGACRKRGTTVFLDPTTLEPFEDQWAFLSTIEPLSTQAVDDLARAFGELATGPDASTYRRPTNPAASPKPPLKIAAQAGAMLGIDRIGVPPALLAAVKHLASLHNPDFYEKERMRFWTGNTPRFIRSYRETVDQLLIPRGLRGKAARIVAEAGSELIVTNTCSDTGSIGTAFIASLRPEQATAANAMDGHDLGVLVAPPASGKTVIGCALIAHHNVPTLVIVDRKPLVEQWQNRLVAHLDLKPKEVGQIGGGRNKPTGIVDVAMVQSLAQRDDVSDLTACYGLVIVDECHHVPAVTFERAVREIPVRRWVGLTATPYRRDGLQALMAMHCGPIRHTMTAPPGGALRTLDLIVHETDHETVEEDPHIQTTFRGLVEDEKRTAAICDDIAGASRARRNCLVLTRWTEHLNAITETLAARGVEALVLHGQMGKKARAAVIERLAAPPADDAGLVLAATASLLGEGFDCPPLDTLFLAFPIKFKGSIVQYVGRVLRPTDTKTRVEVHDYVDTLVPVLTRMHDERRRAYATLGFDLPKPLPRLPQPQPSRPSAR
ncbi:MAG: TOTE conflict system archaeo-eukaryotic primase domain-containing protein [Acidimicrobiales bacterium]